MSQSVEVGSLCNKTILKIGEFHFVAKPLPRCQGHPAGYRRRNSPLDFPTSASRECVRAAGAQWDGDGRGNSLDISLEILQTFVSCFLRLLCKKIARDTGTMHGGETPAKERDSTMSEDITRQELATTYSPKDVENTWYGFWEQHRLFHAEADATSETYTIVIPPPNVTGRLTMGHVLNNTLQDVFIRWNRLQGLLTCWIPGTDHAGIATQTVVERELKETQGLSRHDLGREEFIRRVWEWRNEYGDIIVRQLRKLGVACDWDRLVFTMDEGLSAAVKEAFIRLYRKGYIYRGKRIINWDPVAHTALSDEEVIHQEQQGKLYYLRYPVIVDGAPSPDTWLVVATTRPETMLGDTAVAVYPDDERYRHLIGGQVLLPLMRRPIPIIADEYVDSAFGTGVVKITPAHDPNDFEVGLRHHLPQINVMDVDASITEAGGAYAGQDRYTARRNVMADLEALGLVEKVEDYVHSVGFSDRTKVPVEPYLSDQWFVRMQELAAPALKVVQDGHVRFHPDRWIKTYEHWMTNIRDWTISRQLWWGHRIPVFYCDACGWVDALHELPAACPQCGDTNIRQDEDVLDTWFSSWLWPFSVHHWPKDTLDLRAFYPTTLLVTAPDIIFFWVARMIMAGLEFMPDIPKADGTPRTEPRDLIPFSDVYFTSIVRDEQGRKMSKSLKNSPDPLEVIDEYGADALRFTITYIAPLGQDVLYSNSKCEIGRNFANKIWNAARFLLMNISKMEAKGEWRLRGGRWHPVAATTALPLAAPRLELEDRWIFSRLHSAIRDMRELMARYRVNDASKLLYDFIWHDFCDWYIELIKERLYSPDEKLQRITMERAVRVFDAMLRLLHPFMPFVTEEIWHTMEPGRDDVSIMQQRLPEFDESLIEPDIVEAMTFLQSLVEGIRTIRGEMNVPPAVSCNAVIRCRSERHAQAIRENTHFLQRLARIGEVTIGADLARPKLSATIIVSGEEVFIPLEGLIDIEIERRRIEKEMERVSGLLRGIEAKLGNERFVANAPADVVEKERVKQGNFSLTLHKLRESLSFLAPEA
jgi:valyl-tRNA synthetase